jgi:wobble nucleotide-excising tRNase
MLKKIICIKNIGRFRECHALGDVEFKTLTLVHAENGRGKTTLCDILRSLKTGNPGYISGRCTLGLDGNTEVRILLDKGVATFKDGAWDATYPDIAIYDSSFVHENVYAGDYIDHEHKKNLYQVIIGSEGVKLARDIERLDGAIRQANKNIATAKTMVAQHTPSGLSLSEDLFVGLKKEDDIDTKIKAKTAEVKALTQTNDIAAKPVLQTLALPALPENFEEILGTKLGDVNDEAEKRIRDHLQNHTNGAKEAWVAEGVERIKDETCPFCAQSLTGNDLIAAYRGYFGDAYKKLKEDVAGLKVGADDLSSDVTSLKITQIIEKNFLLAGFWGQFIPIDLPTTDIQTIMAALQELRERAISCVQQKHKNLLEAVAVDNPYKDARTKYENALGHVAAYNVAIEKLNLSIAEKKAATKAGDLVKAQNQLIGLTAVQKRFEPAADKACKEYLAAKEAKKTLEKDKEDKKTMLDEYSSALLTKFETRINELLEMFNAGFRIGGAQRRYVGGKPSSTYQVVINNVAIELGDSSTPIDVPSFRNTLSAGDRSTLALAFFIARAELDPRLSEKILIVDDPFTSQDRSRRTCTQQRLCKLAKTSKQVVALSHEPSFLKLIWDAVPDAGSKIKPLQLCRMGLQGTTITEWDIIHETRPEYFKNHKVLTTFVNDSEGERMHVARTIRPVIEEYLRFCFPGAFGDAEWLGDMIGKIRNADDVQPIAAAKDILDALEDINDYSKKYHHDTNSAADTEPIDDGELQAFVKRTLSVVGGC